MHDISHDRRHRSTRTIMTNNNVAWITNIVKMITAAIIRFLLQNSIMTDVQLFTYS